MRRDPINIVSTLPVKTSKLRKLISEAILIALVLASPQPAQNQNSNDKTETYGVAFLKSMYSNVNYNDAKAALKVYIDELQRKLITGYKMKPVMFDNVEDLLKNFSKENLADITLTPVDFLKYQSRLSLYPVLVSSGYKSPFENYLILAGKNEGIKSLDDLAGKKLGMLQEDKNSIPLMWLEVELCRKKLPSLDKDKFIEKIIYGKSESQLILSLFFKQIDVCLVSRTSFETMIELNPQIKDKIVILAESPGYITEVSSFTKKFNFSKYSTDLFNTLLKLDDYTTGKQLFALSKTAKIIPYKEEYLVNVKELISEYGNLVKEKIN